MSDESQMQTIAATLQEILAELRRANEREEKRDEKSLALKDRFSNL